MSRSSIYGLTVEADLDLHDVGAATSLPPDVTVTSLPAFSEWTAAPAGELRLHFETEDEPWYTVTERPDGGWHFRVHGMCDFWISRDMRHVELAMHESAAPGMDGVMVTGTLLSLLLYLRGVPVFHGSAVDVGGEAIAFVGHSGQGKTTMATLFCAEGAHVVTDDVLVLDDVDTMPHVRRGSRELRMRAGIESIADRIPGATRRVSADSRNIISPRHADALSLPLRVVVIPAPNRSGAALRFERLNTKNATLALMRYPRLMGWRDERVLSMIFQVAAHTAASVPVVVAHIPWGPPFPDGLADALLEFLSDRSGDA